MNSINLIGNKNHDTVPAASDKLKLVRAVAIVLLFGVSSGAVILYILIAFSPLPEVQQQERSALTALSVSHPEMTKIALLNDRLTGISEVLSQRNSYPSVLDSVAVKMPPGVTFKQIDMRKKNLAITVQSNSLDLLSKFIENMTEAAKNKEYAKLTLNNIITDNQSNNFTLTLSVGLL